MSMDPLTSTEVMLNFSSPEHNPPASLDYNRIISAVVLSICFLLGVPGNIAVLVLKPNWQHLSAMSRSFMLNLALSDLLCLLPLPLWIYSWLYDWTFGELACKLLAFLSYCSVYCSLLNITALSVHRYLHVVYSKTFLNLRTLRLLILIWLASMILSIPFLVVRETIIHKNSTSCQTHYSSQAQQMVVLLIELLLEFSSISVVGFTNIHLYRKVDNAAFFKHSQTMRLIKGIIITFFVFWMPYLIMNLVTLVSVFLQNESLMRICMNTKYTFGSLTFVNSCLDPFIYAFTSSNTCSACSKTVVSGG